MIQEQRIEELERQNRRFRRTGMAVLVTVLGALVVGVGLPVTSRAGAQNTPQPGVLTGSEFRLVDNKGATRAVLAMESGQPVLRLLDPQGKARVAMLLYEDGGGLVFSDGTGHPGASMGVNAKSSTIAFGRGGNVRAMLTVDETGTPKMVLKDTTGHVAWTAP